MMIIRLAGIVIAGTLSIFVAAVVWLLAISDPNTELLDQDLAEIKMEIAAAVEVSGKYSGGLVKGLIDARVELLRTTEAMLAAKRQGLIRRVNLIFNVEGKPLLPASMSELRKIETDIIDTRRRIGIAELKAQQFSGGLVQAMALATVETERFALAQLHMTYYSTKYGLAVPLPKHDSSINHAAPPSPGSIVTDKEAL